MGNFGQAVPVLGRRDDHFEPPACVQDRAGEDLVRSFREVAQADKITLGRVGEMASDVTVNEALGRSREAPAPGSFLPSHRPGRKPSPDPAGWAASHHGNSAQEAGRPGPRCHGLPRSLAGRRDPEIYTDADDPSRREAIDRISRLLDG
jgi:hypothetical protein